MVCWHTVLYVRFCCQLVNKKRYKQFSVESKSSFGTVGAPNRHIILLQMMIKNTICFWLPSPFPPLPLALSLSLSLSFFKSVSLSSFRRVRSVFWIGTFLYVQLRRNPSYLLYAKTKLRSMFLYHP